MPVLYGIFMYMGISSLSDNQFMSRLGLFITPEKHQPDLVFLRHVRTIRVHFFTIVQIICLVLLFVIQLNNTLSITFPLMVKKIKTIILVVFKSLNRMKKRFSHWLVFVNWWTTCSHKKSFPIWTTLCLRLWRFPKWTKKMLDSWFI